MKYEKWSFGYYLLKKYVQFADWIIYKNIIVVGKEKIPDNRPIVFAPNHQNALSDPLAILLNIRLQPVWLARADIFQKRPLAAILKFLKIMPVYRMRDGKDNMAKNDETFATSIKVLENNSALGLFPEATYTGKRQMFAPKRAIPRIVFRAEENAKNTLDIQIIPTGIYYSSYWKFNRTLIVNFGDPIPVNNYMEEYRQNPGSAILKLRDDLHQAVLSLVVEIGSKKYYNDFETIRKFYGKHYLQRQNLKFSTLNLFHSDRKLAEKLDVLEAKQPEETAALVNAVNQFHSTLNRIEIRSWLIENPYNNFYKFLFNQLLLLLGLPIFLFGFMFNAIPFFGIDALVRIEVKDKAFWSTFFLILGITVFPLIYAVELTAVSSLLPGVWLKLLFLITLPISGKIAFKWFILFRKTIGRRRLFILKQFSRKEYYAIFKEKELLFHKLDKLISL